MSGCPRRRLLGCLHGRSGRRYCTRYDRWRLISRDPVNQHRFLLAAAPHDAPLDRELVAIPRSRPAIVDRIIFRTADDGVDQQRCAFPLGGDAHRGIADPGLHCTVVQRVVESHQRAALLDGGLQGHGRARLLHVQKSGRNDGIIANIAGGRVQLPLAGEVPIRRLRKAVPGQQDAECADGRNVAHLTIIRGISA